MNSIQFSVQVPAEFLAVLVAQYGAHLDASRPAWCDVHRELAGFHREIQREMFGACRAAGLDTSDRAAMLAAINRILGTSLTSRRQMSPLEMLAFTLSVQNGWWAPGWWLRTR